MTPVRVKDLKELLAPLYEQRTPTPSGGYEVHWETGPLLWGKVDAIRSADGYSPHSPGGNMTTAHGSVRDQPRARYHVIIPVICHDQRYPKRLLWKSRFGARTLVITRQPALIQHQRYYDITTVEINNDRD